MDEREIPCEALVGAVFIEGLVFNKDHSGTLMNFIEQSRKLFTFGGSMRQLKIYLTIID